MLTSRKYAPTRNNLVILGLDPGSAKVGYGVIESSKKDLKFIRSGLLEIAAKNRAERLLDLEKSLLSLLRKTKPGLAAIEKLYFTKNRKTGMEVAEARGVLTFLVIKNKIPILEFAPREIKLAIAGYGLADKKAMLGAVAKILNIKKVPGGDDAADALACAIAAALRRDSLLKIN